MLLALLVRHHCSHSTSSLAPHHHTTPTQTTNTSPSKTKGFFFDPVEREVEEAFLPWLLAEAQRRLDADAAARAVASRVVADAVALNARRAADVVRAADAATKAAADAEAAAARVVAERAAAEAAELRRRATFLLTELQVGEMRDSAWTRGARLTHLRSRCIALCNPLVHKTLTPCCCT